MGFISKTNADIMSLSSKRVLTEEQKEIAETKMQQLKEKIKTPETSEDGFVAIEKTSEDESVDIADLSDDFENQASIETKQAALKEIDERLQNDSLDNRTRLFLIQKRQSLTAEIEEMKK